MAQNWFEQNAPGTPDPKAAPKAAAEDNWFTRNAPGSKPSSVTAPLPFTLPSRGDLSQQGVKIVGHNSAGQPILAPMTSPHMTPAWRRIWTTDDLRAYAQALKTRVEPGSYTPKSLEGSKTMLGVDQALTTVHNVGARALQGLESMVRHPIDSAMGMAATAKDVLWDEPKEMAARAAADAQGIPFDETQKAHGPLEQRVEEFKKDYAVDPRMALENAAGDVLGLYLSGKLIEGAGEVAGRTPPVKAVGRYATQTLPVKMIAQLIRPSAADVKFGKNPAQAILDEGIVGNSLPELGDKVYARLQEVGKKIDRQAKLPQNASKVVDVSSSLKPITDAMVDAQKAGDTGLFNRLNALKKELTYEWKPFRNAKGEVSLRPVRLRNLRMSPADALEFKRMVGDKVRWTGNDPFENAANEAAGKVYGAIKDQVNQAVPGLKDLNERYSNLVSAGKAIERRIPVEERNAAWHLSDIVLAGTGHLPVAIARKALTFPAVKTRVARGLYEAGTAKVPPATPGAMAAAQVASAHRKRTKTVKQLQAEAQRLQSAYPTAAAAAVGGATGGGAGASPATGAAGGASKGSRSLAAAMALPVNKGKSEAEVEQHLRSLGYNVTRP